MPNSNALLFLATATAALSWWSGSASAAFIVVHGGPAYTPGAGGYTGTIVGAVNDWTTAVGSSEKRDASGATQGLRAIRWDGAGNVIELQHLGTDPQGHTRGFAEAINASGAAVGHVYKYTATGDGRGRRAVRWDAAGAVSELQIFGTNPFGDSDSHALGINDAGTVIGQSVKYDDAGGSLGAIAVRWDAAGAGTELGHLGTNSQGVSQAIGQAINSGGDAVGTSIRFDASGNHLGERAVRWDRSGTPATELGHLRPNYSGRVESSAVAINDAGTAVGASEWQKPSTFIVAHHAVRWDASSTTPLELESPPTPPGGYVSSHALAINSTNMVVGTAERHSAPGAPDGPQPVRWDADGRVTELQTPPPVVGGSWRGRAYDINDDGIAVGFVQAFDSTGRSLTSSRAVYWGFDGSVVDLNTLIDPASGWDLREARAISNAHWIAGSGIYDPDGAGGQEPYPRLFLVQIPEPGTFALVVTAGLLLPRQRRGSPRRGIRLWAHHVARCPVHDRCFQTLRLQWVHVDHSS